LENEHNEKFEYVFNPYEDYYLLSVGHLTPGIYHYKAVAELGRRVLKDEGSFIVKKLSIESMQLTANRKLMYELASRTGGENLSNFNPEAFMKQLKKQGRLSAKTVFEQQTRSLIDIPLILFLILSLLITEWFLRKYFGSY